MHTKQRKYCRRCEYPLQTCICSHLSLVDSSIHVSIMQDPSEVKHAKNTARLIPLLLSRCEIFVGESPDDFLPVQQKLFEHPNSLLLYPVDNAIELSKASDSPVELTHILLLDGTWRKAKKLYLNNPWLHSIQKAKLGSRKASQYRIRKVPSADSYSTIEALAFALASLEGTPTKPFMQALEALQSHWRGPLGY